MIDEQRIVYHSALSFVAVYRRTKGWDYGPDSWSVLRLQWIEKRMYLIIRCSDL
uniref:Uncharacterized protein n=1 Tax=Octopus bimaculoides TaxID=37653 RepID=A0A0L8HIH8_OCTBM